MNDIGRPRSWIPFDANPVMVCKQHDPVSGQQVAMRQAEERVVAPTVKCSKAPMLTMRSYDGLPNCSQPASRTRLERRFSELAPLNVVGPLGFYQGRNRRR